MGDEASGLEPVGRRTRPAYWIGAWAIGLLAVAGLAFAGRAPTGPAQAAAAPAARVEAVDGAASAAPDTAIRPNAAPVQVVRPPLGEDGLIGGLVFGTSWPLAD